MTPSRRRSARPQRREDHRPVTPAGQAAGSVNNPIVLEGNPPPQVPAVDRNKGRTKDKEGRKPARDSKGRFIKSESSMKPGKGNNKVTKKTPAPKKEKARPEKLECVICATSKNTKRCFKASSWDGICDHFQSICDLCVSKMIKTKISERQLTDAHLPCAFPSCDIMLDHAALKHVLTKALFTTWDDALAKHLVAADPSNVACLNPKCGAYFSTEGCNGKEKLSSGKIKPKSKSSSKSSSKNKEVGVKATCPYCEHDQCLSCTRPWHTGSCDSVKQREDKKSEQTIKKMGAKPCPQCGVNIQKQGGCDHMKCQNCRHNFCWECLGIFRGNNDDHAETCSHRRAMIAHDIGIFAHEDLTEAQINALIERARQERDQGRVPRPNLQLAPGVEIVHGVAVHTAPPRPLPGQGEPAQRVAMPPHDNAQFNAFFQQVRQLLGLPAMAPQ